jgi:hypothetical protein
MSEEYAENATVSRLPPTLPRDVQEAFGVCTSTSSVGPPNSCVRSDKRLPEKVPCISHEKDIRLPILEAY